MAEYDDDRRGMMRVHVASQRADLACGRYTRNILRNFAMRHGVQTAGRQRYKRPLAWEMAQHGLIDDQGLLRDGFPEVRA